MIARDPNFPNFNYQQEFLLLGSCFSTNIGDQLKFHGFRTEVNPLGVVFHPLALAEQIMNALKGDLSGKLFTIGDVVVHSLASSEVYGIGEEALFAKYSGQVAKLRESLLSAEVLVITFGSMHGYLISETGEIVANCHKQPASTFTKVFSEVKQVVESWKKVLQELRTQNPKINVVFTVSPVRYTRDGIIENNRSKARLIEVITQLGENYFPSFELINDVLRDFRYFELDQSHPNADAIRETWKLFMQWSFDAETLKLMEEVREIRNRMNHRFLFPDSETTKEFQRITNEKRELLHSLHPYVAL